MVRNSSVRGNIAEPCHLLQDAGSHPLDTCISMSGGHRATVVPCTCMCLITQLIMSHGA